MEKIIIYLEAIKGLSKDLHYETKGASFYGNHLLMDRIHEHLDEYQDEIKENFFMYNEKSVPTHKTTIQNTIEMLPADDMDVKDKMATLLEIIRTAVYQIEQTIKDDKNLDAGDNDLLGRISSTLKNDAALLQRVLIQ